MPLHHQIYGKGKILVLIHGFCEDSFIWDDFIEPLSNQFRVITIDLPGFGKSLMRFENPILTDFAQSIEETLREIGVEKCVLIGHSLGGYITMSFAKQFPQMLAGLGLFHSNAFADSSEKRETRNKSVAFIQEHGTEVFARNMFGNLFSAVNRPKMGGFMTKMAEKLRNVAPENIIKTQMAMRDREDNTAVLANLDIPVMLIAGKEDQSTIFERSVEMSQIPKNAICYFWDEVGHMGMFEQPQRSLMAMKSFAEYCY